MKTLLHAVLAVAAAPGLIGASYAQTYPTKPVRIVVPFSPGGGTDIVARLVSPKLAERFGQPFIVDNRLGAAGTVATEFVARSAPDGHTLQVGSSSEIGIGATLHTKTSYRVQRDLIAVSPLASTPMALVIHPSLPAKTVKDLVALAKARPGELNYGSAGAGTGNHMCGELFRYLTKVRITHIPYKGAAPAQADIVGGQIHFMFSTVPASLGLVQAGRLRALAVTTEKRYRSLPGVPTMIEAGIANYQVEYWYGFFAPAATPLAIVERIHEETAQQIRNPDMIASLEARGLDPLPKARKEFEAYVNRDIERWGPVVKDSGATGF
ncbi:MAG: tripartite tricarboxylate transporter substrate binding protein [Burkholderiales bacterium]|nr:tripartite tricarboxylate transporter substrate binding protein [Burkholderiales bacterium]